MTTTTKIEWTKRTQTKEIRQVARCGQCKNRQSRLVVRHAVQTYRSDQMAAVHAAVVYKIRGDEVVQAHHNVCAKCNAQLFNRDVQGTYSDSKKCSMRCQNSIGPNCECLCAGKNHGAAYGAAS